MTRIRSVKTEKRLAEWVQRLSDSSGEPIRAIQLYCGDHWHVLRTLEERQTKPENFKLWIASAGWGLISSEDKILSYGATFSHLDPDSVIHPSVPVRESRLWWNGLIQSNPLGIKSPSSLASLAKRTPETPMLVALPPGYLVAVRDDLLKARSLLRTPEHLVVVSAGTKKDPELYQNLVPADSRLQKILGGSMTSLNARIARFILEKYPSETLRATTVIQEFEGLLSTLSKNSMEKRALVTDQEISQFISNQISLKQTTRSHTSLLRAFRDLGKACEQRRFRRIYQETVQNLNEK